MVKPTDTYRNCSPVTTCDIEFRDGKCHLHDFEAYELCGIGFHRFPASQPVWEPSYIEKNYDVKKVKQTFDCFVLVSTPEGPRDEEPGKLTVEFTGPVPSMEGFLDRLYA